MPKKPTQTNMTPRILSSNPEYARKEAIREVLPEGASLIEPPSSRRTANSWGAGSLSPLNTGQMGSGGSTMYHMQRPYHPQMESPDRMQLPQDRKLQNDVFRLFHKYDSIFGSALDMYAEMTVSDFDMVLPDSSREIRDILEFMNEETHLNEKLKFIIREFLVVGEAIPHLFFDDELGIWTYIALHNPDNIEIKDTPFINTEPIINYIPDENLRALLQDSSKESRELRQKLTPELVSKILAKQKIRLAETNCSFIARKLSPYDIRGTSLGTRLWRLFMIEDAAAASTIATYRRHACFVSGTKVLTTKGIKYIEDMQVGDVVISGEGLPRTVEAAWSEEAEEIVTIKVAGGENLECTTNHRFKLWVRPRICACGCGGEVKYTSRGTPRSYLSGHFDFRRDPKTGRYTKDKQTWNKYSVKPSIETLASYDPIQILSAEDIRRGDYLMIPRKFNEIEMEVTEVELAKARLLGYYAAEGTIRSINNKLNAVLWSFSLEEYDTWAQDVIRLGDIIGLRIRARQDFRPNDPIRVGVTRVDMDNVKDQWFVDWCIENAGRYRDKKVLSEAVMSWPLEMKKEFLIGLYRGDGHSSCNGEGVFYASVSKSLAYQVRMILAQMGIFGNISVQSREAYENWNDCYKVISSGFSNRRLRNMIWQEDVEGEDEAYGGEWCWLDDDYMYMQVLGVSIREENSEVYNLTVEGDHSYIANGVSTLNSPIKVAKLGDPASGHIPSPDVQNKLLELLTQAEIDPHAWLVHDYMVNFEAWGTTDRAVSLGRENQWLLEAKLTALGLSKSFVSGEASFACQFGDAQITTGDGGYKDISRFEVGETVTDIYGKEQEVEAILKYPSPDEVVHISSSVPAKDLFFTGNHELPIFRGGRIERLEVGDLRVGDCLLMPYRSYLAEKPKSFTDFRSTEDFVFVPISGVERVKVDKDKNPYVYSLTVKNSHSYITSNIASYNSVKGGLQVFLRRLLSMRQYFEKLWLIPKYFRPISEVNDWTKPVKSEIQHKYRIKRTAKEITEQNQWIIPEIRWKNRLDPAVDSDMLAAYAQLKTSGIPISKETMSISAGVDYREEYERVLAEFKYEQDTAKKLLGETMATLYKEKADAAGAKPPGGPGAGAKPPSAGAKPPGGGKLPPPKDDSGGAPGAADKGPMDDSIDPPTSDGMPSV